MKLIFEPGDVVRLKSGSPTMTVDYVGTGPWGEDTVYAVWFEEGSYSHCSSEKSYGTLRRGEFAHDSLDPVKTWSPFTEILKAVEEPRNTSIVDLWDGKRPDHD